MAKANWLKVALKKKEKKKSKNLKVRKEYRKEVGAEFPIFVFSKGKKIKKIKDKEQFRKTGLHLGSVLLAVRDGTKHCKCRFSYNKSIQ